MRKESHYLCQLTWYSNVSILPSLQQHQHWVSIVISWLIQIAIEKFDACSKVDRNLGKEQGGAYSSRRILFCHREDTKRRNTFLNFFLRSEFLLLQEFLYLAAGARKHKQYVGSRIVLTKSDLSLVSLLWLLFLGKYKRKCCFFSCVSPCIAVFVSNLTWERWLLGFTQP